MATKEMMSEVEAFKNLEPHMKSMLELCIHDFAHRLYNGGLIDDVAHKRIFYTGEV